MTDEQFREEHKPIHVPAYFADAETPAGKVVFALADLGAATAEQIIRRLEELGSDVPDKPLIADIRQLLDELTDKGAISAIDRQGELIHNLHKITRANEGAVNQDLLASGLD
jgi:hypothetical protein